MLELNEIFAPVDFSGASRTSLALARSLAERRRAQLRVVHAVPDMLRYFERTLFPYAGLGDDRLEIVGEIRKSARRDLVRYHHLQRGGAKDDDDARKAVATAFEVEVLVGKEPCAVRLGDRLAESTSDLVVLGRSGRGESPPGRLGSVAAAICASSTRPVIVARATDAGPTTRILIALDLSPRSAEVLRVGLEAAALLEVPAQLVVVAPPIGFGDVGGILGGVLRSDARGTRSKVKREISKAIDRLEQDVELAFAAKDRLSELEVGRQILSGDPVEELVKLATAGESDLLVVGASGQRDAELPRRLGRVAEAIVANAPCHALVVPTP